MAESELPECIAIKQDAECGWCVVGYGKLEGNEYRDAIYVRQLSPEAKATVRGLVEAAEALDQSPWCNTDPPYTHWHVSDKDFSRLRQTLAAFEPFRKEFEE